VTKNSAQIVLSRGPGPKMLARSCCSAAHVAALQPNLSRGPADKCGPARGAARRANRSRWGESNGSARSSAGTKPVPPPAPPTLASISFSRFLLAPTHLPFLAPPHLLYLAPRQSMMTTASDSNHGAALVTCTRGMAHDCLMHSDWRRRRETSRQHARPLEGERAAIERLRCGAMACDLLPYPRVTVAALALLPMRGFFVYPSTACSSGGNGDNQR
jgi:hypothetical protein